MHVLRANLPEYIMILVHFSVQVVTAPMSSMNAIAVEAYKKYILVSLIHLRQVCVCVCIS